MALVWLQAQCCGVVSTSDWGSDIPQSCKCNSGGYGGLGAFGGSGCTSKPMVGFVKLNEVLVY